MRYRRLRIEGGTYFFTVVTLKRRRLFEDAAAITRWHEAVARVAAARPFDIDAEVILPDHIHVLWTLPKGDSDYPTRLRLIKSAFTRAIAAAYDGPRTASRIAKRERAIWQRRYWEHTIADESDFRAHLDYIHYNPVKHGLVARPADWPHSTFADWIARGAYEPNWGSPDKPALPDWAKVEPVDDM